MARIICPNKEYTGVSASVPFLNGIGETDDPHLIEWFKAHGYDVETDDETGGGKSFAAMTVKALKVYAEEHGIDIGEAKNKAEIIAAVEKAETADPESKAENA
jgi:hypothetical protein